MEITVLELHLPMVKSIPSPARHDETWIRFKTRACDGVARLITSRSTAEAGLIGSRIDVESGYDLVNNIRLATGKPEDVFHQISDTGGYRVVGTVKQSWPDRVVVVQVYDIRFMVSLPDDWSFGIVTGIRIEFDLHGLSFWDTNL